MEMGEVVVYRVARRERVMMSQKETYAYYMGQDIEMLLRCDAVLMADKKWRKSKGCSIEHNAAMVMDIEIFYNIEDIPDNGDKSY